jgi:hypothetical protein
LVDSGASFDSTGDKHHCDFGSSVLNSKGLRRVNKKTRFPILITIVLGLAAYMAFSGSNSQRCEEPIAPENLMTLEAIATEAMRERPSELVLIGLKKDGSDLILQNSWMTKREIVSDTVVDHPDDLATRFLYTNVNGYDYLYTFDDCNNLLNIVNRNGFILSD